MRILLTGGAGFVGHHIAEHLLRTTEAEIVFLDRLDCSGNLSRLADIAGWRSLKTRCKWVWHDLKAPISRTVAAHIGQVSTILHLAAGTHVDRSITDPLEFVYDNVVGTAHLLEYARQTTPERVFYFSTDEVFGPAKDGEAFAEWARYKSGNPYSATKAGAEELCLAYHNTYKVPVRITHCMNIFGERQSAEKFIPLCISKILQGETIQIHADAARQQSGSRFYIHARNVANAITFLMDKGEDGEKYNIVGQQEVSNLELAGMIADIVGKPLKYELVDFHSSRPGHDLRYALDGRKMAGMGWKPPKGFAESLEKTVRWTLDNRKWLA